MRVASMSLFGEMVRLSIHCGVLLLIYFLRCDMTDSVLTKDLQQHDLQSAVASPGQGKEKKRKTSTSGKKDKDKVKEVTGNETEIDATAKAGPVGAAMAGVEDGALISRDFRSSIAGRPIMWLEDLLVATMLPDKATSEMRKVAWLAQEVAIEFAWTGSVSFQQKSYTTWSSLRLELSKFVNAAQYVSAA